LNSSAGNQRSGHCWWYRSLSANHPFWRYITVDKQWISKVKQQHTRPAEHGKYNGDPAWYLPDARRYQPLTPEIADVEIVFICLQRRKNTILFNLRKSKQLFNVLRLYLIVSKPAAENDS
jgi:hypothetical protein